MRTRIACGWLVGHADGHHTLWRDAELVYEGNTVLFVGERFNGAVDHEIDARDKLVAPGFIDTHVHSGHRASHRLISDIGRGDYFGQPFLEISVAREGARVGGDPRYVRPDDNSAAEELLLNARFTIAELLRNGITTFVEFGSQLRVQEALLAVVGELGVRRERFTGGVPPVDLRQDGFGRNSAGRVAGFLDRAILDPACHCRDMLHHRVGKIDALRPEMFELLAHPVRSGFILVAPEDFVSVPQT